MFIPFSQPEFNSSGVAMLCSVKTKRQSKYTICREKGIILLSNPDSKGNPTFWRNLSKNLFSNPAGDSQRTRINQTWPDILMWLYDK
jgi:hypothetical protein